MKAIVAVDTSWGIGREGELLYHISADLKRFKALTLGHPVILGRKTLSTFPGGKPLPGRPNLVLSRDQDFHPEGVEVFRDLPSLLEAAPQDSFVIGGESVYRQFLPYCKEVYVTHIRKTGGADAFFPDLTADPAWVPVEVGEDQEEKGISFRFVTYRRK